MTKIRVWKLRRKPMSNAEVNAFIAMTALAQREPDTGLFAVVVNADQVDCPYAEVHHGNKWPNSGPHTHLGFRDDLPQLENRA